MPVIHPYMDQAVLQAVFLTGVMIVSIVAGLKAGQTAKHHEQR
jgi:hypothetical protein